LGDGISRLVDVVDVGIDEMSRWREVVVEYFRKRDAKRGESWD